ncbi:MAG: rRNA adenine dimethyltransferase family protein [bacterium]
MAKRTDPDRRSRGAHFLDPAGSAVARIVEAAALRPGEHVLDVGAGAGAITRLLCTGVAPGGSVVAVEKAPALAQSLEALALPGLTVTTGDALKVRLPARIDAVVANPPYRIIPGLLARLLEHGFGRAVLVMPRELAERLTAKPGDEAYGKLTVQMALRAKSKALFPLRRHDFHPPPDVASHVVAVVPKAPDPTVDFALLDVVLDAAWSARKRTLRHSLAPLAGDLGLPSAAITQVQEQLQVGARTATQVSPWEYGQVSAALRGLVP